MHHARQLDVADIEPAALHQPVEVRPRHRLADIGVRPVQRRKRFGICLRRCHGKRPARASRCGLDGVDDGLVAGTAAIVAGKMFANLFSIRTRRLLQQILRRHQHCRRTEAALQRVALPECRLQIGNLATVGDPLDRLNRRIVCLHRKQQARADDIAIDADCACTAHPVLATDMRSGQLKMLAKKIRQVQARQYARFDTFAIDNKRDRYRSRHVGAPARRSGRSSSDDTQRANRTFARCRRMAGVA